MARNRQRAKQRQAERRAQRLSGKGGDGRPDGAPPGTAPDGGAPEEELQAGVPVEESPVEEPRVEEPRRPLPTERANPDDVLRGEPTLGRDPREVEAEAAALREIEDWEVRGDRPGDAETTEEDFSPRGRRGEGDESASKRPRVVQFLIAVWAELQRVQWPNRQALTTLTGVVLGFVLIAGGYLGLLDAIFSRLIQAIL